MDAKADQMTMRYQYRDDRPSLTMTHMSSHNECFNHNERLMAYFVLYRNGEDSLKNELLSPDPDHLRGGPSYMYNTSCVKNQVSSHESFLVTHQIQIIS